jgi:hypothetical protein
MWLLFPFGLLAMLLLKAPSGTPARRKRLPGASPPANSGGGNAGEITGNRLAAAQAPIVLILQSPKAPAAARSSAAASQVSTMAPMGDGLTWPDFSGSSFGKGGDGGSGGSGGSVGSGGSGGWLGTLTSLGQIAGSVSPEAKMATMGLSIAGNLYNKLFGSKDTTPDSTGFKEMPGSYHYNPDDFVTKYEGNADDGGKSHFAPEASEFSTTPGQNADHFDPAAFDSEASPVSNPQGSSVETGMENGDFTAPGPATTSLTSSGNVYASGEAYTAPPPAVADSSYASAMQTYDVQEAAYQSAETTYQSGDIGGDSGYSSQDSGDFGGGDF